MKYNDFYKLIYNVSCNAIYNLAKAQINDILTGILRSDCENYYGIQTQNLVVQIPANTKLKLIESTKVTTTIEKL